MRISIDRAHALVESVMKTYGYDDAQAETIAEHLLDSELRGFGAGGLSRAVTVAERLESSDPFLPIKVIAETDSSLAIDGGDQAGYIVAKHLTERLIEKARSSASVVGTASNTWCTGMFTFYLEMLTAAGLAGFIASSGGPIVAPHGGSEARFGTNPVAFGFPTDGEPIIWDIGTSSAMIADLVIAHKSGVPLADGMAFDAAGRLTTSATDALNGGAITTWGGHKGSGLAVSAQLLGMMAGSAAAPPWLTDMGLFIFVVDPDQLSSNFATRAGSYAQTLRETRPVDPTMPVRVPFARSLQVRREMVADGHFEVADTVVRALEDTLAQRTGA